MVSSIDPARDLRGVLPPIDGFASGCMSSGASTGVSGISITPNMTRFLPGVRLTFFGTSVSSAMQWFDFEYNGGRSARAY